MGVGLCLQLCHSWREPREPQLIIQEYNHHSINVLVVLFETLRDYSIPRIGCHPRLHPVTILRSLKSLRPDSPTRLPQCSGANRCVDEKSQMSSTPGQPCKRSVNGGVITERCHSFRIPSGRAVRRTVQRGLTYLGRAFNFAGIRSLTTRAVK